MSETTIAALVDELTKWDKLQAEAKAEMDKIKAKIQKKALEELESSKLKQVKYFGSNKNCAIATISETVKIVSFTYLKSILGKVTEDFVKPDTNYKMTDPFKKIAASACLGNYVEQTLAEVIQQMGVDEKQAKFLKKKLKGSPDKDAAVLASIGMSESDIEHWIYFIAEAVAYERICVLLEAAGYEKGSWDFQNALDRLKAAVITEESLKIGVEYEE